MSVVLNMKVIGDCGENNFGGIMCVVSYGVEYMKTNLSWYKSVGGTGESLSFGFSGDRIGYLQPECSSTGKLISYCFPFLICKMA